MNSTIIKPKMLLETKDSALITKTGIDTLISESWSKITPFWPLRNLIAVNPLAGLEDLSFEDALIKGASYFQQEDIPAEMQEVNRQSIKWLQAFFDDGQATIKMPLRQQGLFRSVKQLLQYDRNIQPKGKDTENWFQNLSSTPHTAIRQCLLYLDIPS